MPFLSVPSSVYAEHVPLPDRMFTGPVVVAKDKLNLNFDGNLYYKKDNGNYYLRCANAIKGMAFELELTPQKIPIRQAHNGVVKIGLKQDTMFYYYIPRNNCVGSITVNSQTHNVTGSAWYDHEFGGEIKASKRVQTPSTPPTHMNGNGHAMHDEDSSEDEKGITVTTETKEKVSYAWNWLSVQLDDGSDITATTLVDTIKQNIEDNFAIVTGPAPQCERVEYPEMSLTAKESWSSIRTTNEYPTLWHFTIPAAQIDLEVRSVFDNQEFITLISKPAFWEGRVNVKGTYRGRNVTGKGFIERHGFQSMNNLDTFFKRISKQVMNTIENIIPLKPTYSQARDLIASSEFDHFMDGVNVEVYRKTVIEPLREIVDRGGKSWRSFAFLLCMDCVGGNSLDYKHWLAMPEVMHVGSLIVDDIQDKSETRRGGPSCHMVHGDAIAINAGTAAYFLSLQILQELTPGLTPLLRNRLYEMYILTLRSGHAGQAFDIYGLDYLMDEAVKGGDSTRLEKSVLATHRLKSAVPAGNLARMGATVGGGSTDQIEKLGMYMESIGLAFQIIDDVLNLRGFQGNVKDRGEDITAGKVTFPVAKSMSSSRCDLTQRQNIWNTVKSKPSDKAVIQDVIQQLETCGALDASVDEANRLVKTAWQEVDACIPDSFYKMLLRAFGWYVLERHY